MFNLFKRKEPEQKICHFLSLFWDHNEKVVGFYPFINAARNCDLEIINIMIYRHKEGLNDDRDRITFEIVGTYDNLKKFEDLVPELEGMYIFRPKD